MVIKNRLYMDTVVQISVISEKPDSYTEQRIERAFHAFRRVEDACSRFSPDSELMLACKHVGVPVYVSPLLFEPLKFALEMAEWTNGTFDPTVGGSMQIYGFHRHYLTGTIMNNVSDASATFRDIVLNEQDRTMLLKKPLVIDLGAVAKGFAIDLAANELKEFEGFLVNAGGDLFAGGVEQIGKPWKIGIQHPHERDQIIATVEVSNEAICTSGSYARRSPRRQEIHHLIDPKSQLSPNEWISCTVVAPFAMMADAFSTASFLLGFDKGKQLLEQEDLTAVLVTSNLQIEKVGVFK